MSTPSTPAAQRFDSSSLFLLHGIAMAAWFVPLSPVLEAHGLGALRPFAFATSAVSALVTPLLFAAIADRHAPQVVVLRWAAAASAVLTTLASFAIGRGWPAAAVLAVIQLQALVSSPTWSLLTATVLSGLPDARRQFGPIRAFGTFGWVGGCLLVSALNADTSVVAGYASAVFWGLVALFTLRVAAVRPARVAGVPSIRERFGLDALVLLRDPGHRAILLTAGLVSIPLAAFYPFTPAHLHDLGLSRTSAWMSLAQVSEVVSMFALGRLLGRWPLKRVLAGGLVFAVVRYLLLATDHRGLVLTGVALHGFVFALFFITAPIYFNDRVDAAWRTRAQALLSLMTQGVGNLAGYLGAGAWLSFCETGAGTRWPLFWSGLTLWVAVVLVYFLAACPSRSPASKG